MYVKHGWENVFRANVILQVVWQVVYVCMNVISQVVYV